MRAKKSDDSGSLISQIGDLLEWVNLDQMNALKLLGDPPEGWVSGRLFFLTQHGLLLNN